MQEVPGSNPGSPTKSLYQLQTKARANLAVCDATCDVSTHWTVSTFWVRFCHDVTTWNPTLQAACLYDSATGETGVEGTSFDALNERARFRVNSKTRCKKWYQFP